MTRQIWNGSLSASPFVEEVASPFTRMLSPRGAEVYITGDIYYHTAQDMLSDGLLALDPGHHIEVLFVSKLVEKLNQWKAEEAWEIEVIGSQASTNPFIISKGS